MGREDKDVRPKCSTSKGTANMDPLLKGWENSVRKGKSHKLQQKDSKSGTIRSLSQPDDGGIEIEMTAHFRKERRPIATEFQSV